MFFHVFLSHLYFDCNCAKCKYGAAMIGSRPRSLARNLDGVNGDQQDYVDSAGQLGPAACNLDVQLCKHGPATVPIEILNNRLCHYGVFGWISCDNQNITNFKQKLPKRLPKIFNYQKSQKNREILPKVNKITKSGHTDLFWLIDCVDSPPPPLRPPRKYRDGGKEDSVYQGGGMLSGNRYWKCCTLQRKNYNLLTILSVIS
jgi:hypothetical protein